MAMNWPSKKPSRSKKFPSKAGREKLGKISHKKKEKLQGLGEVSAPLSQGAKEKDTIPRSERMGTMTLKAQNIPESSPPTAENSSLNEYQKNLAQSLLAAGALSTEELEDELNSAGKKDSPLGRALLKSGYVRAEKLYRAVLSKFRLPRLNLKNTKIPSSALKLLPAALARELRVIPIEQIGSLLCVVTDNVANFPAIESLRLHTKSKIALLQCSREDLEEALEKYYSSSGPVPVQIQGIPFSFKQQAQEVAGRYLDWRSCWERVHLHGAPVVPWEARL